MRAIADDTTTQILREQFIPDHVFIYILQGAIQVFDGNKNYVFKKGDAFLARKNRLAKYQLLESKDEFLPILFCFDEPFLRSFQKKHAVEESDDNPIQDAFVKLPKDKIITSFIQSIKPYYKGVMALDEDFEDLKYQELLVILLKIEPELYDVLFDFRIPGKIDLENFMDKNYMFNIGLDQFALLTGRSLSAFKRDFKSIFGETPSRWLVKKRLQEAYFLMKQQHKTPKEIYLDLGFESLSHFSVAFKKVYGQSPSFLK